MNAAVKDVMTTEVVAVRREVTFKELQATLRRYRVSALPVVDDMGKVLGVVSEADLLAKKALADPGVFAELVHDKDIRKAEGLTAGDLMTRPAVTASPDDPVEQAARNPPWLGELPSYGAVASTTQTGPRANVMTWPDMVVNVVPLSALGRDQRTG
jgi:predicted transcriptional regulator